MDNTILSTELKQKLIEKAIESIDEPWKNLTVKEVAKDLYMGENKANEVFSRPDFPAICIGKTKKVTTIAYLLWKLERRVD
ncbi:MAG: hypothetical protein IKD77_05210 [Bacilli bacterium]|nr:hypothetical protein [Bacilli bacterium]